MDLALVLSVCRDRSQWKTCFKSLSEGLSATLDFGCCRISSIASERARSRVDAKQVNKPELDRHVNRGRAGNFREPWRMIAHSAKIDSNDLLAGSASKHLANLHRTPLTPHQQARESC